MAELIKDIENYWTDRAKGYSEVNQFELACDNKVNWLKEIKRHITSPDTKGFKMLDIGTGPGFFSIILTQAGYDMTAIDYTDAMMEEAKKNAGELASKIEFIRMDAQNLTFEDNTFDAIVTRNLTWNLEKPERAYSEWLRVLKKGGVLLNYDANWYQHLFNKEKRAEYENDREKVAQNNLEDHFTCTDIDTMEEIARKVPLSNILRPEWDIHTVKKLKAGSITTDLTVWQRVWSDIEKVNYASTPMFLVKVIK